MAVSRFTGTPEEFRKKQREEGMILVGDDAERYFKSRETTGASTPTDPNAAIAAIRARGAANAPTEDGERAAQAQETAASQDLTDLEAKGRRNLQNFQVRQQYRDQQAAAAQAERERRAGLAASWQNNPAKSWDEAANRYNQLNITSKASEWAAEAKRRQDAADASAKEIRDRHAGYSAGAMTALTWAQRNPEDKSAQNMLNVALEDIGNSLAQEQGMTFDAKSGIKVNHANGELQATLTWTKADGTPVSKTFSPSSLRQAHKGEELDNVLRQHWTDMTAKTMEKYKGTQLDQAQAAKIYADIELNAKRLGLDIQKENFQEAMTALGVPVPDGKGGYVVRSQQGSGAGAGSTQGSGVAEDPNATNRTSLRDQLMRSFAKEPPAWAMNKDGSLNIQAVDDFVNRVYPPVQQSEAVAGSKQADAIPGVDALLPGAQPNDAAVSPAVPAAPTAAEAAATPAKQTAAVPPVAVQANAETQEDGGVDTDNASVASYSRQAQEISSAVEEASRPLSLDEVRDKTPARGREYVTQTTVASTNASRKSNAKTAFDRIDNTVRKAEPVGDGTFKVPKAGNELEAKIYNSLGLVPDKYATKAQIDKAIAILDEVKTGPKAGNSPSSDPTSAAGSEPAAPAAEDVTPEAEESVEGEDGLPDELDQPEPPEEEYNPYEQKLFDLLVEGSPETDSKDFREKHNKEIEEAMKNVSPERRKMIRQAADETRLHNVQESAARRSREVVESNRRSQGGDTVAKVGFANDLRFGRNGRNKISKEQADKTAEFVSSVEDFGLSEEEKSVKINAFVEEQMATLEQIGGPMDEKSAANMKKTIRNNAERFCKEYREHKAKLDEKRKIAPRLTKDVKDLQQDAFANRGLADSLFDESQCKPRTGGLAYEWAPNERNAKNLAKIEKELQRDGVNQEPFEKTYNEDGKLVYVLTRKQRDLLARYFAENLKSYDVDTKLKNSEAKFNP